ncbi:MAG: hypothetical protein ABIQ09_13830 [Jatrophihabitantaceae bacterium]
MPCATTCGAPRSGVLEEGAEEVALGVAAEVVLGAALEATVPGLLAEAELLAGPALGSAPLSQPATVIKAISARNAHPDRARAGLDPPDPKAASRSIMVV